MRAVAASCAFGYFLELGLQAWIFLYPSGYRP